MTLLITVLAGVCTAAVLYFKDSTNRYHTGTLCLIYWGAGLMWAVDAVTEYLELGAAYFSQGAAVMLNDALLGLSVTALGLVIWLALLLMRDPKQVIRKSAS